MLSVMHTVKLFIVPILIARVIWPVGCSIENTVDNSKQIVYKVDTDYRVDIPKKPTDILKSVTWWISWFKFYQKDFRPYADTRGPSGFTSHFMKPALSEVFEEVKNSCDLNFGECLVVTYKLSRKTVHWTNPWHEFRARATAMYYFCWYTMLEEPMLSHFGFYCKVAPEYEIYVDSDIDWVETRRDYRDNDTGAFDCALLHFCPDPCCGAMKDGDRLRGIVTDPAKCVSLETNPCHNQSVGSAIASCYVDLRRNQDFVSLAKNQFNTSCNCGAVRPGFTWDKDINMCVDIDECAMGNFNCEPNSVCRNLPGDYYCTCRLGYKFNGKDGCEKDKDFEFDENMVLQVEAGETELVRPAGDMTVSRLFKFLLPSSASRTLRLSQSLAMMTTTAYVLTSLRHRRILSTVD